VSQSDPRDAEYWRRQAAGYRMLLGEVPETEIVEVEFPDDGPTSPINIALAIQELINAARAWREKQRPEQYRRFLDALAALDAVEDML